MIVGCIEEKPTRRSVKFGGTYINVRKLSQVSGVDEAYVSRMLSGKRDPRRISVGQAMLLAGALGLGLDEFIVAVYERQQLLSTDRARLQAFANYLESREMAERRNARRDGRAPSPSIPLTS